MRLDSPLEGKRVRLISTGDPYTNLKPGDEGVVRYVDHNDTAHITWDNGSSLGMVEGVDRFEVIE